MANPGWLSHVRKTMYENAGYSFTQMLKRANKTYKNKKKGGSKKQKKTQKYKKTLNRKIKKKKNKNKGKKKKK